jgi:NitT/TauT family transport system substrate-binding protein
MKHLQVNAILALFLILFSINFTACNKKSDKNTIRIGVLEGPSAVSFIKLIDKEHIIDGKKIEIIIRSEPFQIQAMMLKNELDFAVLPTIMAANLYNKGVKYRMIACPIWGTLYIMTNNDEIQTLHDLKEEEIAVFGQNSTADILTRHKIRTGQIECKGLNYRFNTNQEVAQALLAREMRVAIVSEPLVSSLLAKDSDIRIVEKLNFSNYVDDSQKDYFIQSAFLVSGHFIQHYSHLIPQVCSAYVASCNFVNENPEIVAQLMVKHNITPNIEIAVKSIELCNIQYVAAFAIMRELHQYLQVFYLENPESIGGKIPEQDFVYQTYSASNQ